MKIITCVFVILYFFDPSVMSLSSRTIFMYSFAAGLGLFTSFVTTMKLTAVAGLFKNSNQFCANCTWNPADSSETTLVTESST